MKIYSILSRNINVKQCYVPNTSRYIYSCLTFILSSYITKNTNRWYVCNVQNIPFLINMISTPYILLYFYIIFQSSGRQIFYRMKSRYSIYRLHFDKISENLITLWQNFFQHSLKHLERCCIKHYGKLNYAVSMSNIYANIITIIFFSYFNLQN